MENFLRPFIELFKESGAIVYIFAGITLAICIFGFIRIVKQKDEVKQEQRGKIAQFIERQPEQTKQVKGSILGQGEVPCLCFRFINGLFCQDWTTIPEVIGEIYQHDPSDLKTGPRCHITEEKGGEIADWNARWTPYNWENSPALAWIVEQVDTITKAFWAQEVKWYRSTSIWFAIALLVLDLLAVLTLFD